MPPPVGTFSARVVGVRIATLLPCPSVIHSPKDKGLRRTRPLIFGLRHPVVRSRLSRREGAGAFASARARPLVRRTVVTLTVAQGGPTCILTYWPPHRQPSPAAPSTGKSSNVSSLDRAARGGTSLLGAGHDTVYMISLRAGGPRLSGGNRTNQRLFLPSLMVVAQRAYICFSSWAVGHEGDDQPPRQAS